MRRRERSYIAFYIVSGAVLGAGMVVVFLETLPGIGLVLLGLYLSKTTFDNDPVYIT